MRTLALSTLCTCVATGHFQQGSVRSLSVSECVRSRDNRLRETRAPQRVAEDSDIPTSLCIRVPWAPVHAC